MPSGIWLVSYLAFWLLLIVSTTLLVAVLRQLRILHSHWVVNDPDWGLPVGSIAPQLPTKDAFGRPVSLGSARGRKTLLVFLSRSCSTCHNVIRELPVYQLDDPNLEVIAIVTGTALQTRLFASAPGWLPDLHENVFVVADPDRSVMDPYKITAVPYAIAVDEDGVVGGKGSGFSSAEIGFLIHQTEELRDRRLARARRMDLPMLGGEPARRDVVETTA
jgi:methylamine dehydrogenase accessory protein MauD